MEMNAVSKGRVLYNAGLSAKTKRPAIPIGRLCFNLLICVFVSDVFNDALSSLV
jgi:hypothetical protein